jgi:hypothetical protein
MEPGQPQDPSPADHHRRPGGAAAVQLGYVDYVRHSTATLSGHYRGQPIAARMPAP